MVTVINRLTVAGDPQQFERIISGITEYMKAQPGFLGHSSIGRCTARTYTSRPRAGQTLSLTGGRCRQTRSATASANSARSRPPSPTCSRPSTKPDRPRCPGRRAQYLSSRVTRRS